VSRVCKILSLLHAHEMKTIDASAVHYSPARAVVVGRAVGQGHDVPAGSLCELFVVFVCCCCCFSVCERARERKERARAQTIPPHLFLVQVVKLARSLMDRRASVVAVDCVVVVVVVVVLVWFVGERASELA
jgi:hypothetical protein